MATIGQLILLVNPNNLDPSWGFLPCDGRAVKQSDYPALYNVIGTSWGYTTSDNFNLPAGIPLPSGLKSPASYYICTNGTDPSLPAPDAVLGRVERFAFRPTLPLPAGWKRPANQQTIPSNYHPCDGTSLQISLNQQNEILFSLIENNYGGTYSTFNLPNVPTDPGFFWGMPHDGYCIVTNDGCYPPQFSMPSDDDYTGQIILMPTQQGSPLSLDDYLNPDNPHTGVLPCSGGILSIYDWRILFDVVGNTYGGDGQNTFALPKLSPPSGLEGHMYFIVTDGYFP